MKAAAVAFTALVGLLIAGCSTDQGGEAVSNSGSVTQGETRSEPSAAAVAPGEDAAGETAATGSTEAPAEPIAGAAAAGSAGEAQEAAAEGGEPEAAPAGSASENATPARTATNGNDVQVRDAKEATEEAARKILDAASRIRDVGRGAVQSVLETTSRRERDDSEGGEGEPLSEAPAGGAVVARNDKAETAAE